MSNKKRTRTQKQRRNVRGGGDGGATGFGEYTYGGPGEQLRGPDGSISMRTGGRNNRKQGGKSVLMDVAVPAVLLYANNNIYKNKTSNKSRKFRRSTRRYRK